jgi:hypothetical protein
LFFCSQQNLLIMNTYLKIVVILIFTFTNANIATAQRIYFDTQLGAGLSNYIVKIKSFSPYFPKTAYPNNLQPILRPELSIGTNYEFSPQWSVRLGLDAHWTGSYHRDTFTGQSYIYPELNPFHIQETERSVKTLGLSLAATYQIKELLYARIGAYYTGQIGFPKNKYQEFFRSTYEETNTEYYKDSYGTYIARVNRNIYDASGNNETYELSGEDFGIFGGFGKTWNDRYSLDLSYWYSLNVLPVSTDYGVTGNPITAYSLRAVMLKLSFGYRFGKINIGKKK